jgi:hypothetical protein
MWNRACPLCFSKVLRSLVLTQADDLSCPSCHAPLELSRPTRVLGALVGLIAAFAAYHGVVLAGTRGSWFISMVAAILAYGIGAALADFFLSDLVVRPPAEHAHFPQTHG